MTSDKIAVIGAGNGGCALAADLASNGYNVSLFEHPILASNFKAIQTNPLIRLSGMREGTFRIALTTTNIYEAIDNAGLINIVVPAHYQEAFFTLLVPYLQNGQEVIIWAGNLGSLRLALLLREKRPDAQITIIETNTIPYGSRKTGINTLEIFALAKNILYASFPAVKLGVYPIMKLIPGSTNFTPGRNVLSASFSNPNPIVHPPGSILNVGRIEYSQGDFYLYREGNTDAILRTIYQVYLEVKSLADAIGCEMCTYAKEHFQNKISLMGANFRTLSDMSHGANTPKGPSSLDDRYFFEDIAFGLVPFAELGQKAGLECRTITSIINLASVICKSDFWQNGRNLLSLGLAHMELSEIVDYINTGNDRSKAR